MPRSLWKGSIAFGLVNIPVELHTAVRDHRPRFRLLHAKDESPVQYERVCQTEGRPVAWEDLVKGLRASLAGTQPGKSGRAESSGRRSASKKESARAQRPARKAKRPAKRVA